MYGLYALDVQQLSSIVRACVSEKPLFTYFVHLGTKYTYPFLYLLKSVYFATNGHHIIRALDSQCFRRLYCPNRSKTIFLTFMLIIHFFVLLVMFDRGHHLRQLPPAQKYLGYLCLYVILNYLYWVLMIVHYYQYATYRSIKSIYQSLVVCQDGNSLRSADYFAAQQKALQQIKELALTNHKLNHLLSGPIIAMVVLNVFNMILVFTLALLCRPFIRLLMHMFCSSLYSKYIVWLNQETLRTVRQIFSMLRQQYEVKEHRLLMQLARSDEEQTSTFDDQQMNMALDSIQSQRIRLHEIDLYFKYFAMRIYHIDVLDFQFIFQISLFILSYVVFFTQTN